MRREEIIVLTPFGSCVSVLPLVTFPVLILSAVFVLGMVHQDEEVWVTVLALIFVDSCGKPNAFVIDLRLRPSSGTGFKLFVSLFCIKIFSKNCIFYCSST